MPTLSSSLIFFFFNDTATTEIYTLSLHDALPISLAQLEIRLMLATILQHYVPRLLAGHPVIPLPLITLRVKHGDRKSTRLNPSHGYISYAVFCLKKKNQQHQLLCTSVRTCLQFSA